MESHLRRGCASGFPPGHAHGDPARDFGEPPDAASISLPTNTVLLEGLRDSGNQLVWDRFVGRYRPLIVRYLERFGLSEAAAQDVAQNALATFCEAYANGRYNRTAGRLRAWLFGIVKNHLWTWRRNEGRRGAGRLDGAAAERAIDDETGNDELSEIWESEWQNAVLRAAFAEIRCEVDPKTMQAFERFALEGRSAAIVARELGMTTNAVFGAKRRVLDRLRELRPFIEDVY